MSKIKIKVTLQTETTKNEEQQMAIWQEEIEKICYQEKDEKKTKVIYDYKNNILIRENTEINMKYSFLENENTTGILKIKELNQELKLPIKTKKLNRKNKNIEIEFQVEEEIYNYKIEVIE